MIFRVTMFKYVIFIIKDTFEVIQLVSAGGLKREKKERKVHLNESSVSTQQHIILKLWNTERKV